MMPNSKKVLGICASSRKNGNSAIILNELLRPVREAGHEVEVLNLGTLKIFSCTGCLGCIHSGSRCVRNDDLELVKQKIEEADAIALASPCYYLSTPSPLRAIMERSANWAIEKLANSTQKKYGVAVSVAGGNPIESSMQRMNASLFLGLYNCEIVGQFTIGHAFNKGEVLLVPSKLRLVRELGENLLQSLAENRCIRSSINECENQLICPNCLADAFQIYKDGTMVCPVCGGKLENGKSGNRAGFNRFSVEGAREHKRHILDNAIGGMLAGDEINQRLQAYWSSNTIPQDDYPIDRDLSGIVDSLNWDDEALKTLQASVPVALQELIKKVVTKKALQEGVSQITKKEFQQCWRF
ncbi:MAG TPA: hypothetical protein DDW50_15830 [Firmicutes bacterium]|jgi:multimeric flavodoxin WrbA|nr:hypothetical protein [Bacillota bacterium]